MLLFKQGREIRNLKRRKTFISGKGISLGKIGKLVLRDNSGRPVIFFDNEEKKKDISAFIKGWQKGAVIFGSGIKRPEKINKKIFIFNPFMETSCNYNPLAEARILSPDEEKDLKSISDILAGPDDSLSNFLMPLIAYVMYKKNNACMKDVTDFIENLDRKRLKDILEENIFSRHKENSGFYMQKFSALRMKSEDELKSVKEALLKKIKIFKEPTVLQKTSKSDFKIKDLFEKEMLVYLQYSNLKPEPAGKIFQVLINQIFYFSPEKNIKSPKLLILGEGRRLGKLDFITKNEACGAVKLFLIFKSISQLKEICNEKKALKNFKIQLFSGGLDKETSLYAQNFFGKAEGVFITPKVLPQQTLRYGSRMVYYLTADDIMWMEKSKVVIGEKENEPIIADKIF